MKEVNEFLEKFKQNDVLVLAISGGPDSMALLDILIKYRKKEPIKLVCAHVNHNVRKESVQEKKQVETYCKQNQVIFETMTINNYTSDNFHADARNIRYQYFEQILKKYKSKYLLTAHHGDDLIETILMKIIRGSSLKGYSGFSRISQRKNYYIVRPFIKLTKEQLQFYVDKHKIPYAIDKSNFNDIYTRNRIRKYILPQLKKENTNIQLKFYKFSKDLIDYNNYVEKQVKDKIPAILKNNQLNIKLLLQEEKLIQKKIIYKFLESNYNDSIIGINDQHVQLIYNLIISKKANAFIDLPKNKQILKSYNNLTFQNNKSKLEYNIELTKTTLLPNGKTIEFINLSENDDNNICRLNSQELELPLFVRTRKSGDRIEVKGLNGVKKIKDIFINEKITIKERDTWPIILDSNNQIVWIPGLKKSKFNKLKKQKYDIIMKYS